MEKNKIPETDTHIFSHLIYIKDACSAVEKV